MLGYISVMHGKYNKYCISFGGGALNFILYTLCDIHKLHEVEWRVLEWLEQWFPKWWYMYP